MKRALFFAACVILASAAVVAQQDAEGMKDHPLFPSRMANYLISESKSGFDAVDFNTAPGGTKIVTKEGTTTKIRYDFNGESGQPKPSTLQILRNYESAVKKMGGVTVFLNAGEVTGVYKVVKKNAEVWVKVETGGNDNNDFYLLTILEIEAMKQEITSNEILTALNADGHIALYINFDPGKSDVKPESLTSVDQIVEMLQANPTLKISVEGHTDNVGSAQTNQVLSENRAKAIVSVIVSKGVSRSRLTSKGWGQTKPIDDNKTEDGKTKNRRVEIVKL